MEEKSNLKRHSSLYYIYALIIFGVSLCASYYVWSWAYYSSIDHVGSFLAFAVALVSSIATFFLAALATVMLLEAFN